MFKKGQLVRRANSPLLWVVRERHHDGNCVITSTTKSRYDFVDERFLTLIGNNYQAKSELLKKLR